MISGLRLTGVLALGMGILGSMMLPSEAGDYRGGNANFAQHSTHGVYFGHRGHFAGRSSNAGVRYFATGPRNEAARGNRQLVDRNRFFANHPHRIQRLASGNFYTPRDGGITIQYGGRSDYNRVGSDAGASDSFATAAGTYSVGYGGYIEESAPPVLAPMAKVIDVATMKNACAYQNGVCVIRP